MPELKPFELKPYDHRSPAKDGQLTSNSKHLQNLSLNSSHLYLYTSCPPDFLCKNLNVSSLTSEPNLHGLVETEVFVGEEERFLEDDQSYLDGVIPSTFVINYHKDTFPHPLNSVKEDVEAEEAEEEETSGNFHSLDYLGISLGPSSLSSSVISTVSLDEAGIPGSERQNLNKYQAFGFSSNHSHTNRDQHGILSKFRSSHHSNSNGKLSPATLSRISPNIVKNISPNSLVKDESLVRLSCCKNSQKSQGTEKIKSCVDKRTPIWHNPSKADKLNVKKDNSSFFRRYGFGRAKSETRETNCCTDNKYSSLPRKKKEKNEKDIAAETYGTLGRNRKKKEMEQTPKCTVNERQSRDLPQESKNILDKYATLPRKKAKELSARWREQQNQKEGKDNDVRPKLQRSKSIGKESTRSVRSSPSPSFSSASNSTVNSPRNANACKQTPKLNLKILSPSARLLARQNIGVGKEKTEKSPSPIYSSNKQPKLMRNRKNVQVQVNLKWDPNENDLEEKLRQLEAEYALLQTRLKTAEANAEEVEQMRMEAVELRRQAENERLEKEELQEELDRTSGKVKEMLTSMDGVEKEFNNRGESLIELESQLQSSAEFNLKMQEKVNQYEDYSVKMKKDLDKSLAAQKILLQQVQDLEAEGREMIDFMAEEKNALSECLKESELELCRQRRKIEELKSKVQQKDEEAKQMHRLAEERRIGYICLQTELASVQSSAEDMMVCQGAQVSGASVALANLGSRLQIITAKLIQDYSISENDIENVVTPVESDSSVSSTNGTPDLPKSPIRSVNRSSSPRKPVSFMQSFMNAMRSAQNSSKLLLKDKVYVRNLPTDRKSPEGSDLGPPKEGAASTESSSPSQQNLSDQVTEIDSLLTRFLKVCCVLKSDADNILSELEDENERLCSQIQLQQQMIDQQYSEFESLSNLESNARKELKLITKDLEFANATLNKVCDDDAKLRVQNVEEALKAINLNLGRMETMHVEKREKITQARKSLPFARRHANDQSPKSRRRTLGSQKRLSVCNSQWKEHKNKEDDDDLNLEASDENYVLDDKEHDLDYIVNHVLKTLETVPDIVSTCPALKNLYLHLTSTDPLEKDVNCNPNGDTPSTSIHHGEMLPSEDTCVDCYVEESSGGLVCCNHSVPETDSFINCKEETSSEFFSNSCSRVAPSPVLPLNDNDVNQGQTDSSERTTNGFVDNQLQSVSNEPPNENIHNSNNINIDYNANPEVADTGLQNGLHSHSTDTNNLHNGLHSCSADPINFIPRLSSESSL